MVLVLFFPNLACHRYSFYFNENSSTFSQSILTTVYKHQYTTNTTIHTGKRVLSNHFFFFFFLALGWKCGDLSAPSSKGRNFNNQEIDTATATCESKRVTPRFPEPGSIGSWSLGQWGSQFLKKVTESLVFDPRGSVVGVLFGSIKAK